MNRFTIRQGTIRETYRVSLKIPEFKDPYSEQQYSERIGKRRFSVLIACENDRPVGFKSGYLDDSCFYSWMGGRIPAYRQQGIAKELASTREQCIREKGVDKIRFKTLNRYSGMLIFALKNGFEIVGTEPFEKENTIKIKFKKQLT